MPVPPKTVQQAAQRALDAREQVSAYLRAGTPVGVARANQLARGDNVSVATLRRMFSYLSRARDDFERAKNAGLDIRTSKAIQAYYLWGGPAALLWVRRELTQL